ncbi:6-phosphogluconolactonase, partial [Streptomyces sp. NPDC088194]
PASGAYGRARTLWLLDRAAAAKIPAELYPAASS